MNKKALVFAVAAACFTSGAAFAQSYGHSNDSNVRNERHERQDRSYRADRNDRQYSTGDRGRNDHRNDYRGHDGYNRDERHVGRDRNDYRHDTYRAPQHFQHRRGGYVSQQYRDNRYVVSDWRGRRLHQPQRGYHWVQAGNDYLLVAIASGLIAQVLLNH
jgi:Ni/Co efflux regulator RcnB